VIDKIEVTYIYALIDPRTNAPFYIGKTIDPKTRLYHHIVGVNSDSSKFKLKEELIQGIINEGLKPLLVILEEVSSADAPAKEGEWIATYRAQGHDIVNTVPPVRLRDKDLRDLLLVSLGAQQKARQSLLDLIDQMKDDANVGGYIDSIQVIADAMPDNQKLLDYLYHVALRRNNPR